MTTEPNPRYELVFEGTLSGRRTGGNVVRELRSLGKRTGSAIGDVYALAARAFLDGLERLEDLNAERRFERHSKRTTALRLTPRQKQPHPRK